MLINETLSDFIERVKDTEGQFMGIQITGEIVEILEYAEILAISEQIDLDNSHQAEIERINNAASFKVEELNDKNDALSTELFCTRQTLSEFKEMDAHWHKVIDSKEATINDLAAERDGLNKYVVELESQLEGTKDQLKRANLSAQRANSIRVNQLSEIRDLEIKAQQEEIIKGLFR